jgi:TP901 family phage tail tape measure protein
VALSPVFVELKANITEFQAKMGTAAAEIEKLSTKGAGNFDKLQAVGKQAAIGVAALGVGVAAASVKMAADFQTSITALHTGAGESVTNLKLVSDGMLTMAGQVGVGAKQLADGMYNIESAGYHGKQGLEVLKTAAEGAKVGGADMAVVADALTSALNAYGAGAGASAEYTNTLISTVAAGKMKMGDLAASLGQVLPVASAAHVGLKEVGAAIAVMTAQGTPAQVATTRLASLMTSLESPTGAAIARFKEFGLSSTTVADTLTHKGLHAALDLVTDTIAKKFPVGSAKYTAALAQMVGGNDQLKAALNLTGDNAKTFAGNIKGITKNVHDAGAKVSGWGDVQKDFNQKMQESSAKLGAVGIRIGTALLPMVTKAADKIAALTEYFAKHKTMAETLAGVIGGVLTVAIGAWVAGLVASAATAVASFATMMAAGAAWAGEQLLKLYIVGATWAVQMATMVAEAMAWAAGMLVAGAEALLPFLPIIAAVALVGVAAYELYKHWDTVWSAITGATSAAVGFLKEHAKIIVGAIFLLFPPLGLLIAAVHEVWTHWDQIWSAIKTATADVWHFLKVVFGAIVTGGFWVIKAELKLLETVWSAVWDGVKTATSAVWHFLKPIFDAFLTGGIWLLKKELGILETAWANVWGGIKTVVGDVWHFLKPIFDKIGAGVAGLTGAVGKVGGVVGKVGGALGFNADGTDDWRGGPTVVGERGPEIVNLPRHASVTSNEAIRSGLAGYINTAGHSATKMALGAAQGGQGGDTINVNIDKVFGYGDKQAMADEMADHVHTALLKKRNRGGSLGLA